MDFSKKKPLQIVIIGGSTAGLMHGLVAKRLGHNVHILEQHPADSREGQAAGISSIEETKEFFDRYDRCQRSWFVPATSLTVRDSQFKARMQRKAVFNMTSWTTLYHRLRANFDGFKSRFEPAPPPAEPGDGEAQYSCGKLVENIKDGPDSVTLYYKNLSDSTMHAIEADLVVAADGSNSTMRQTLLPEMQHTNYGILCWRAVIPERLLSPETVQIFENRSNFFYMHRSYVIVYIIPGENGTVAPGQRALNFVWYWLCDPSSAEFTDIMTDVDGHVHRGTLPPGKMRPEIWQRQRAIGHSLMSGGPAILDVLDHIDLPFVTAVSDGESPRALLGKEKRILLVGDALCLLRPHIARSTNQAAVQSLAFERVLKGEMGLEEWEGEVLRYAHVTRSLSTSIGDWFLKGWGGYLWSEVRYRVALLGNVLGYVW